MMQYGIIDGVKDAHVGSAKRSRKTWLGMHLTAYLIKCAKIASLRYSLKSAWIGKNSSQTDTSVTVAEYIQALSALPPHWQVCVLEDEWGRFVEASEPTLCVAYVKGGMLYDCGPDGSEMR